MCKLKKGMHTGDFLIASSRVDNTISYRIKALIFLFCAYFFIKKTGNTFMMRWLNMSLLKEIDFYACSSKSGCQI